MKLSQTQQQLLAFIFGLFIATTVGKIVFQNNLELMQTHDSFQQNEDVHVHSDFLIYIDGIRLDLSGDEFMSSETQLLNDDMHLHDNDGHVMHRHAEGITLAEFFASLGLTLTDDCIYYEEENYCSDLDSELRVYVNGEYIEQPSVYINSEADQILVYFGDPQNEIISSLLDEVTDESCIYSGTCPERGVAPAESCGLTCDL